MNSNDLIAATERAVNAEQKLDALQESIRKTLEERARNAEQRAQLLQDANAQARAALQQSDDKTATWWGRWKDKLEFGFQALKLMALGVGAVFVLHKYWLYEEAAGKAQARIAEAQASTVETQANIVETQARLMTAQAKIAEAQTRIRGDTSMDIESYGPSSTGECFVAAEFALRNVGAVEIGVTRIAVEVRRFTYIPMPNGTKFRWMNYGDDDGERVNRKDLTLRSNSEVIPPDGTMSHSICFSVPAEAGVRYTMVVRLYGGDPNDELYRHISETVSCEPRKRK